GFVGTLDAIEQAGLDIGSSAGLEVPRQLLEDMLVETVSAADTIDLGPRQGVQAVDGVVQIHRRVEQQGTREVELSKILIKMGDKGRIQRTETEASQAVIGDLQLLLTARMFHSQRHRTVQIPRIILAEARQAAA